MDKWVLRQEVFHVGGNKWIDIQTYGDPAPAIEWLESYGETQPDANLAVIKITEEVIRISK